MQIPDELLDRFRARLRQVHLGSLRESRRVTLTREDEELLASVLMRCRDVPWILEAPPPERWRGALKTGSAIIGAKSNR